RVPRRQRDIIKLKLCYISCHWLFYRLQSTAIDFSRLQSRFSTRYSLHTTRHSLLATRHSPLATRHSLLATRYLINLHLLARPRCNSSLSTSSASASQGACPSASALPCCPSPLRKSQYAPRAVKTPRNAGNPTLKNASGADSGVSPAGINKGQVKHE
ncbi:MAG: hypothetical protein LBC18_03385, partial [Opitutaceae bacterium]|nr:hypothetical protein [Opitutaceae bacterium]